MIEHLNKAFENRIRLGIMSVLVLHQSADFQHLKSLLGVTDGNLSSHASALEKNQFIIIEKGFEGKKTKTTYSITPAGSDAFKKHIDALENLINNKT